MKRIYVGCLDRRKWRMKVQSCTTGNVFILPWTKEMYADREEIREHVLGWFKKFGYIELNTNYTFTALEPRNG